MIVFNVDNKETRTSEIHSEPCQTSGMELITKIVNGWSCKLFLQEVPSWVWDRVLNTLLNFILKIFCWRCFPSIKANYQTLCLPLVVDKRKSLKSIRQNLCAIFLCIQKLSFIAWIITLFIVAKIIVCARPAIIADTSISFLCAREISERISPFLHCCF